MANHGFMIQTGHPCLYGHFPGAPIVPGVVVLDQVGRAVARQYGGRLRRVVRCKFVAALYPDQACTLELAAKPGLRLGFVCNGPQGCVAHGLIEWSPALDG